MKNHHSPRNLVTQWLSRNYRDFLDNTLICVKIKRETSVIFLNDDLRGLLHCLGSDTTLEKTSEILLFFRHITHILYRNRKSVKCARGLCTQTFVIFMDF